METTKVIANLKEAAQLIEETMEASPSLPPTGVYYKLWRLKLELQALTKEVGKVA